MDYSAHRASPQRFALRPLEIKQLFDFAIRLYRANFTPMFTAMALAEGPLLLVAVLFTTQFVGLAEDMQKAALQGQEPGLEYFMQYADQGLLLAGLLIGSMLYQVLVLPLGMLTCSRLGASSLLGRPCSLAEAFEFAKRRYWPTQVSLALFFLPLLLLSVLLLLPVLVLQYSGAQTGLIGMSITALIVILLGGLGTAIAYYRCYPALSGAVQASEEPQGFGIFAQGQNYLKRAWALTEGYGMRSFGLLLLFTIAQSIIQRGISESVQLIVLLVRLGMQHKDKMEDFFRAAAEGDAVSTGIALAIATAISLIFPALQNCYLLLMYFDLRCRKEGYDLLYMLDQKSLPD